MNYCPVCGYKLRKPVEDHLICPCCGTQFGYTDATSSHLELRQQWIDNGSVWKSRRTPPPQNWNPVAQLANLEKKLNPQML